MSEMHEETEELLDDATPADETQADAPATEEQQSQAAQADAANPTEPEAAKRTDPPPAPPAPPATPTPEKKPTATKLVALNDIVSAVRDAVWYVFERMNTGIPGDDPAHQWPGVVRVYDDFGVVTVNGTQHWRFEYTYENGVATVAPRNDWQAVEPDWVIKTVEDATVIYPGTAVKAIGKEGDGWVGGYLVSFTDANHPDLVGDFFDESTDFGPHGKSLVWFNHALDPVLGHKTLGVKSNGRVAEASLRLDPVGVWIETQLDMRDEYERAVYALAQAGKLGWSSGTATHLVKRTLVSGKAYHIDSWPLGLDASMTPTPAAGPKETAVVPLKSYRQRAGGVSIKSLMAGLDIPDARKEEKPFLEVLKNMDPEELLQKFGDLVDAKLAPIATQVGEQAKTLDALKSAPPTNRLPQGEPANDPDAERVNAMKTVAKSAYVKQFGEPDGAMKAVMTDIIGTDYEYTIQQINRVFTKWVRLGSAKLTAEEERLLNRQLFSPTDIKNFIFEADLTVSEIKDRMARAEATLQGVPLPPYVQEQFARRMGGVKDTMFTGSGVLGGYALAPMRDDIASRLPGSTVVRAGGARVVDLLNSTSIEVPVYAGGNDRYRGAMRGSWGGEKAQSPESNAEMEMASVQAHPYTFKVPITRSLLINASNLIDLLTTDILDVASLDEDEAFLIGTGTSGKPLGIIPGGAYLASLGINRVQHTALSADKLIELSDSIDDQYTEGAMFVFKKATGTAIRKLKADTDGDYLFSPGIANGAPRQLLGHDYRRNQAMPAVAAGACPVLFGNMAGYMIVQEPGMTIERFQDSGTGLGKVEFHVWRMLGGRVIYPWMFSAFEITN